MNTQAKPALTKGNTYRTLACAFHGEETSDGAGVRIRRFIGTSSLNVHDPFLLFDVFHSDDPQSYIHGFPEHPHRGFETVTYLFHGRIRHRDNSGHQGVIEAGGVQWMRAGRGILHSEMPEQKDGLLSGIQLWINLPKSEKMSEPAYQEFSQAGIPVKPFGHASRVHIVAGRASGGLSGPIKNVPTHPVFLDIELAPGDILDESLSLRHTAILYVHQGRIQLTDTQSSQSQPLESASLATLTNGNRIRVMTDRPSRFLIVAAKALNEPIARAGPFVMNTREEIKKAFLDYEQGRF
jgi:hypothetical protein